MKERKNGFYNIFLKRLLDLIFSILFLLVFWWLYLVLAILVKTKLGSPVLFSQDRPGMNGKIFKLYKFRTMTDQKDENGKLLPDEIRLTKFGKTLRSTSLDELPEILNIIKGQMSFIGPRPLMVSYLERYNEEQKHRHDVRPGLSGYAQVHGRNSLTWSERFKLDVYYVNNISLGLDIKILFYTIKTVFKREGISSETSVTMEEFLGNN